MYFWKKIPDGMDDRTTATIPLGFMNRLVIDGRLHKINFRIKDITNSNEYMIKFYEFFTDLDFETATGYRNSICQVGLVRVENGIIIKEVNICNHQYSAGVADIHGISAKRLQCTCFRSSLASNCSLYRKSKYSGAQWFWL
jgi:hypothetical protein